ncbi:MAG: hypothetical protein IKF80_09695 [Erysipelotrichaceae bacterium]|nr:hypothetical protein [Erysipelotrichaceae bacterium]
MENKDAFEKICNHLEIDPIVLLDPNILGNYLKTQNSNGDIEKIDIDDIRQYITSYGKGFR